jgi:NADH-quinone oxidoreductase subunit C
VPQITPDDLRERLRRDLPAALWEPPAESVQEGAPQAALLATSDVLVAPAQMVEVASYLRDALGYALLSDLVAIDFLEANVIELAYIFYHPSGGTHLIIRVRLPRDLPEVPSLTPSWPGAELVEREAYDLFGVQFVGHPYLKRIYMWDEFEGYPMRKDFPKQGDKYLDEE